MSVAQKYFDTVISRDFFYAFCGEELGSGIARTVFEHAFDRSLVVKVETAVETFQNVKEWELWNDADASVRRWLAPIVKISPCGTVLIQKRVEPITDKKKLPKKVPWFFTDLKISNWGKFEGRYVACDYGSTLITTTVNTRSGMKRADWWDAWSS